MSNEKKGFLAKIKDKASTGLNSMISESAMEMIEPMIRKAIPKAAPRIKRWFQGQDTETAEQLSPAKTVVIEYVSGEVDDIIIRIFYSDKIRIQQAHKDGVNLALAETKTMEEFVSAIMTGNLDDLMK